MEDVEKEASIEFKRKLFDGVISGLLSITTGLAIWGLSGVVNLRDRVRGLEASSVTVEKMTELERRVLDKIEANTISRQRSLEEIRVYMVSIDSRLSRMEGKDDRTRMGRGER